ncbi:Mov34/MPN/PAD-1 family protein [Mesorhizobium tamadayense]|uniref:Mov34/MPN/PAD-1 family protein n=1 Tax=Mesorhizobium tamadayense TaxID=425306 RepID=UPI00198021B0|nr:Mov34/MPN/PAD-1 family protein [Mesorhizobium tamadayense]
MIRVGVSHEVRDCIKPALRRAGSREIGGILMGQEVARGHFAVVDFSLDEISGERAHFVRDADHHRQALENFFDRTGHNYQTFNYLGEWHSHPSFSAQPSVTDLRSMQDLVDGERGIEFAVLLIVKLGFFRRFIVSASLHRRGREPEPVELTTN